MASNFGAPDFLEQWINPVFARMQSQFGLVNIYAQETRRPDAEAAIVRHVASYGKQLGRMQEVMEVLIRRLEEPKPPIKLEEAERHAIEDFRSMMRDIARTKKEVLGAA